MIISKIREYYIRLFSIKKIIKIRYSIEPISQKLLDSAKKSTTDPIKTASKRAIQNTAEATGDLIGNKIAYKITSVSTDLHSKKSPKQLQNDEMEAPKKRYMTPEERQQIIDEIRLLQQYNNGIWKSSKFVRQCIKSTI